MNRCLAPFAIGTVVLYAALAIGAANCLLLRGDLPTAHHHNSQSPVTHSALCAWACQANPTVAILTAVPLVAALALVAMLGIAVSSVATVISISGSLARAPPR
jgi:hypothetical protein